MHLEIYCSYVFRRQVIRHYHSRMFSCFFLYYFSSHLSEPLNPSLKIFFHFQHLALFALNSMFHVLLQSYGISRSYNSLQSSSLLILHCYFRRYQMSLCNLFFTLRFAHRRAPFPSFSLFLFSSLFLLSFSFCIFLFPVRLPHSHPSSSAFSGIDKAQRTSAKFSQRTNLIVIIFVFTHILVGMFSEYEQNLPLYSIFTILNGVTGMLVLVCHCFNNQQVRVR